MVIDSVHTAQRESHRQNSALWKALRLLIYKSHSRTGNEQTDHAQKQPEPSSKSYTDHGRRHHRYDVGDNINYRGDRMPRYDKGIIENISKSGIAITAYRELDLGQTITLLVENNDGYERPLPLMIYATVTRLAGISADGLFRYGCEIERVNDPND